MLVGYARVSTQDQNLALQNDALTQAGCEKIFTDKAGGAKALRSGLTEALNFMRQGDTLVVWRLDRLGRSLKQLVGAINMLNDQGVGFMSLQEKIDTTSTGGKLVFHIFAALAEFEHDVIRERTQAGLAAARARGRLGGRPRVMDQKKIGLARSLYQEGKLTVEEICSMINVSRATFYRYVRPTGK